ncbi:hypothetical protein JCM30471_21410 [Desulfuromonas carbonis]|nr:PhoH-related ATPase [Desulfuromonas sp. DDH964]
MPGEQISHYYRHKSLALEAVPGETFHPHQCLVVDEAQNLTPHEVKTIITRAGEGTTSSSATPTRSTTPTSMPAATA